MESVTCLRRMEAMAEGESVVALKRRCRFRGFPDCSVLFRIVIFVFIGCSRCSGAGVDWLVCVRMLLGASTTIVVEMQCHSTQRRYLLRNGTVTAGNLHALETEASTWYFFEGGKGKEPDLKAANTLLFASPREDNYNEYRKQAPDRW